MLDRLLSMSGCAVASSSKHLPSTAAAVLISLISCPSARNFFLKRPVCCCIRVGDYEPQSADLNACAVAAGHSAQHAARCSRPVTACAPRLSRCMPHSMAVLQEGAKLQVGPTVLSIRYLEEVKLVQRSKSTIEYAGLLPAKGPRCMECTGIKHR